MRGVFQESDLGRRRFGAVENPILLLSCTSAPFQKFLMQFRRQSRSNRRTQVHSYCINTDELAFVDLSELSRSKLLREFLKWSTRFSFGRGIQTCSCPIRSTRHEKLVLIAGAILPYPLRTPLEDRMKDWKQN